MENKKKLSREGMELLKGNGLHIFRLYGAKCSFKQVDRKEWEVMAVLSVMDYVLSNGFSEMLFIKRIGDHRQYIKREDKIFILMNQAQGEKLKLRSEENGLIFAELLAKFHNAAEGFVQPPGIKVRVDWGKRMERYRMSTSRLEKYINYIQSRENLNEFEEYTQRYTEMLINRARASMKILRSLGYLRALEGSMKRKEICINDISSNTAILCGDKAVICKILKLGYNMVEEDIAALVKKLILETGELKIYDKVIEKYSEFRGLEEDSGKIIKALVSYPFDSIRIILKYYNRKKDMLEEDISYNSVMLEKYKKYISRELLTDVLGV